MYGSSILVSKGTKLDVQENNSIYSSVNLSSAKSKISVLTVDAEPSVISLLRDESFSQFTVSPNDFSNWSNLVDQFPALTLISSTVAVWSKYS